MYYSTAPQIDRIFSARREKNFYLIPWDAIHTDINAADISNHTARNWAENFGKIYSIDEFEDNFNSGIINPKDYYIRVF
jgi:hypothetical protein